MMIFKSRSNASSLYIAEKGAKVVCLEKNSGLMGTSAFAEGFAGVNSKFQAEQGVSIDAAALVADAVNYHHCGCLAPVVREMVYSSGATIDWLEEDGVSFAAVAALGNSYPTWHTGALDGTDAFSDIPNYTLLMQPTLHVNENARRYFNEAFTSDFTSCGNALSSQGENYVIVDDAYIDHIEKDGPWMPMPNLGAFAGQPFECREGIEGAKGLVKADTIEELAEKLGLDAAALSDTIEKYNGYCEAGVDEEYGKPANMLLPVSTPPYYGGKVTPTLFTTVGGLKVNPQMQVVNEAGAAIGACTPSAATRTACTARTTTST